MICFELNERGKKTLTHVNTHYVSPSSALLLPPRDFPCPSQWKGDVRRSRIVAALQELVVGSYVAGESDVPTFFLSPPAVLEGGFP